MTKSIAAARKRQRTGRLLLAGAASITIDQQISVPKLRTTRQALAADIRALRNDYAIGIKRISGDPERA